MKGINVIYSLIGIVILALLVWFIYNQTQKNKISGDANKGVPTCVAECPDGKSVTYPCNEYPRCAPATQKVLVFTPNTVVNPELIKTQGKNFGGNGV